MKQTFITLIFLLVSIFAISQEKYKTEIELGGGFSLTTFLQLNKEQNRFTLTSPKNGDKRVIGGFKSTVGRMFGKLPKKGIFVSLSGTQKGDSLIGNARVAVLGVLQFKGILKGNEVKGDLLKKDGNTVATIHGIQTSDTELDYGYLYQGIIETTRNNIYSKDVLQTREWKKFKKSSNKLATNHKTM